MLDSRRFEAELSKSGWIRFSFLSHEVCFPVDSKAYRIPHIYLALIHYLSLNNNIQRPEDWQCGPRCRKKYVIYIEWAQHTKADGSTVHVDIHLSSMGITRLKLEKDWKKILERQAQSQQVGKEKGKKKDEMIETMQE